MTAAFNLSQLANNLNTSGQLDATDGLTGLVSNANLASSGTASSSTFLRGDRTWATAGLSAATSGEAQAGTSNTVAITPLQLRNGLNASGSAPVYAPRAWVSWVGTGTVSIYASGNVSSISDLGTGDYQLNFSTSMQDGNYAVVCETKLNPNNTWGLSTRIENYSSNSTSSVRIRTLDGGTARDAEWVSAVVVR